MRNEYEIINNKLICENHGEIDKYIMVNNHPECPHCLLQFLLINDIDTGESLYKNISWDIIKNEE